jgi:predicted enzyme related to lactoylglutathione lyase
MANGVVHFEIIGTDGPALEKFYADVFGWHIQSIPGSNYGLVDTHAGGGINGGIGTAQEGQGYVTFYVEVPDPQQVLDQVAELGGSPTVPVMDMGTVVFAQFTDPQGNRIGLVKEGEGPGPSQGDGARVDWFEILGPDPAALVSFYGELFGWTTHSTPGGEGMIYYEMDAVGKGIPGGIGSSPDERTRTNVYAFVDDPQALLDRAESMGGTIAMPVTELSDGTRIGQFADPQGLVFGIYHTQH